MKTQIKQVTKCDGTVLWYPQRKFLFWWLNLKYGGLEGDIHECYSIEEAKCYINTLKKEELSKKISKIEYIKYP